MVKWTLIYGIAGKSAVRNAPIFDNKRDATERANQENRYGELRGRGVKAAICDNYGNVDWARVR